MLRSTFANNGMVVAPHHLAAETGRDVLRDGGNAIEAVVAAAATIAVVYPVSYTHLTLPTNREV